MTILPCKIASIIIAYEEITPDSIEQLKQLNHFDWYASELMQRKTIKRKSEFASAILLLNEVLNNEPQIAYDNNHKPYLLNLPHKISISHSHNYVCVAISKDYEVGIDIEPTSNRATRVSEYFISKEERDKNIYENIDAYSTEIWCAKEATYKIVGRVAQNFVKDIQISYNPSDFVAYIQPLKKHISLERINGIAKHTVVLAYD